MEENNNKILLKTLYTSLLSEKQIYETLLFQNLLGTYSDGIISRKKTENSESLGKFNEILERI